MKKIFLLLSLNMLMFSASAMEEQPQNIWQAAVQGNLPRVIELLQNSDVTEEQPQNICQAAGSGNLPQVTELLQHGQNVNAQDDHLETPLMHAASANQHINKEESLEVMKLLIKAGAGINWINQEKQTALHLAIHWGNLEKAQLLIEAGADLEAADQNGLTPLFYAIKGRGLHLPMVKLLIDAGANAKVLNRRGDSILMTAVTDDYSTHTLSMIVRNMSKTERDNYFEMINLLVKAGADLDETDNIGNTARSIINAIEVMVS
jgi:ankyrin repeat protein